MKSAYKILTLYFCVFLLLTACQNAGKQEKNTANEQKQASADTINTTQKTENEKQDKNNKIQETNSKTIIPITVNLENGELKKAYVDKDKLVDYINSSDSHEFYYEDFKDTIGLEIAELFDYAEDFGDKTITTVFNHYPKRSYQTFVKIINKSGKKLFNENYNKTLDIIDNNSILYESDFSIKLYNDPFNAFFIVDTNKKIKKFLGFYSHAYVYKNIISLYRNYTYSDKDSEEYSYDTTSEKFIPNYSWSSHPFYYDLKEKGLDAFSFKNSDNTWIRSSQSNKHTYIKHPDLEGNYLVGEKKWYKEGYIADIYDLALNKKFIDKFVSFYYLGDHYYAAAKHLPNIDINDVYYRNIYLNHDWQNILVRKAIYDEDNFTDYKYFIIKYVGNDIFYLFDGNKYQFYNIKTKKPVLKHVNIAFNINDFKVYDDLIIANINDRDYENQVLITDKNYMITKKHQKIKDCEIITEHEENTLTANTYPRFVLKNKQAEAKINSTILELFEIEKENPKCQIEFDEDNTAIASYKEKSFKIGHNKDYVSVHIFFQFNPCINIGNDWHIQACTFDITTGKLIQFEDLFKDPYQAKLFIAENFKQQIFDPEEYIGREYVHNADKLETGELSAYDVFFGEKIKRFNFYIPEDTYIENSNELRIEYPAGTLSFNVLNFGIFLEELKPYLKDEVIQKMGI